MTCLSICLAAWLLNVAIPQAAQLQEIVLRPDLPAGEEWYSRESTNPHVKSPTEK